MSELKNRLPSKLYEMIERVGITTTKQIILLSKYDIKKLTNLNDDDILFLKDTAADCHFSATEDLLAGQKLLSHKLTQHISTGCNALDIALKGGFRSGKITEIYGESGSGKTQIAIQSTLYNWRNGTVYICTEELFPIKRFNQILQHLPGYNEKIDYGRNVFIEFLTEISELISCLCIRLSNFLIIHKVSLIIIDSIAGPFRSDSLNYVQRAQELRKVAIALLQLAKKHNIAIVCLNQVSASFKSTEEIVIPSLGLAWSNMISTRLWIKRPSNTMRLQEEILTNSQEKVLQMREMSIIFAPDLPNTNVNFKITSSGVQECD